MYLKHKLIGAAAVLVTFAGIGTATALAQGATTARRHQAPALTKIKAVKAPTASDTDNVQQGDQNGSDVPGATETSDPPEAATATARVNQVKKSTASETDSATETDSTSDGPGGHADPAGNVDHQFDGQE